MVTSGGGARHRSRSRCMPRSPPSVCRPTPITLPPPEPEGAGQRARCARRWSAQASAPPTSSTSTRTRRPPRSATWPSPPRSRRAFGADADHMPVSAAVDDRTPARSGGRAGSVFTILAVANRLAPAAINVDDLDPQIHLDVVHRTHRELPSGDIAALNNSFGFGGQCRLGRALGLTCARPDLRFMLTCARPDLRSASGRALRPAGSARRCRAARR